MNSCSHNNLVLLPQQRGRIRCRHCHLTMKSDELVSKYCPECFESSHKKQYDFEEIEDIDTTQYRCEDCGVLIDCHL